MTSVWVVYYGNYFPREVDSVWLTRDGAEQRASILVGFRVEEWPVGERLGIED